MFVLKRVEMTNFRSFGEAVFEPPVEGVTALTGVNGSGKSSLVEALSFALVGVIRKGTNKDSLRRQGSEGLCQVRVTIEHDGQDITIVRGIQGTKNDTVAAIYIGDDPEPVVRQADPCTEWIRERLGGIEREGLLVATLIRQKELADIVSDTPAIRRQRIERLAGIERMAEAVKTARSEATAASKALDFLPGSAEEVADAEKALGAAQEHAITLWEKVEKTQAAATAARGVLEAAEKDLAVLETRQSEFLAAERTANEAVAESRSAREKAETLAEQLTQRESEASGGDPDKVAEANKALTDARALADRLRDDRTKADAELAAAKQAHAQAERSAQQATARAEQVAAKALAAKTRAQASDTVAAGYAHIDPDAGARLTTLREQAHEASERSAEYRAQYNQLKATVETFDGEGHATCPTCTQDVHDKAQLRSTVEALMANVTALGKPLAEQALALKTQADDLAAQIEQARVARETAARDAASVSDCENDAVAALADKTAAEQDLTAAADRVTAATKASGLAADPAALADAEKACQDATEEYARVQNAARAAASLPDLRKQAVDAAAEHSRLKEIAEAAIVAKTAAVVPAEDDQRIRAAAADARVAHTDTHGDAARADGDFRVAETEITNFEKDRDKQRDALRKRATQANEAEQAATAAAVLDEFRRRRVAQLAPEIADIASMLLCTLTDGKFTGVELDEAFTPTVLLADGVTKRQASWLSGGETDALAFALRVAIGEVVAGGATAGLLVLDEAVSAQDEGRRQAMMHAIQSLTGRQVVSISHMHDVTGLADNVFTVIPDDDAGSRIVLGDEEGPSAVPGDVDGLLAAV